jgi:hypothetical protein
MLQSEFQDVLRSGVASVKDIDCMGLELIWACGTSEVVDLLKVLGDLQWISHIATGSCQCFFLNLLEVELASWLRTECM